MKIARLFKNFYKFDETIGGAGTISCKDCDFNQKIVGFIHGFGKNSCSCTGVQCQTCGKLHDVERRDGKYEKTECECGDKLDFESDKYIFCPACKSFNMSYHCDYMT